MAQEVEYSLAFGACAAAPYSLKKAFSFFWSQQKENEDLSWKPECLNQQVQETDN